MSNGVTNENPAREAGFSNQILRAIRVSIRANRTTSKEVIWERLKDSGRNVDADDEESIKNILIGSQVDGPTITSSDEMQRIIHDANGTPLRTLTKWNTAIRRILERTRVAERTIAESETFFILPNDHAEITVVAPLIFTDLAETGKLFMRGSAMVELRKGGLVPLTPDEFRSRLPEYGKQLMGYVMLNNNVVLKPKQCSKDTSMMLMKSSAAYECLPQVNRVARYPVLSMVDGEARTLGKGWHDVDGGLLVISGREIPKVEPQQAAAFLARLLYDFDFSSPADKSRAIAMMLTPALKAGGFINGPIPADVAEANVSQSGKTYRQRITRAIYGEIPYMITRRTGGVGSLDESISAGILSGKLFVAMDNMRGHLDSQILEAAMTLDGEPMAIRIPHHGEQNIDAEGISWQLTSNGVNTTRDFANRACIVRILKRGKEYQWLQWPEGCVISHIKKYQAYYLGCVHSLIRAWVAAGMPKAGVSRAVGHDFHEWAKVVDWMVQMLFGLPAPMTGHAAKQEQVSNPYFKWLRDFCMAVAEAGENGKDMKAHEVAEFCTHEAVPWPHNKTFTEGQQSTQMVGVFMKMIFREVEGDSVEIDRYQVTRKEVEEYLELHRKARNHYIYSVNAVNS